MADTVYRDPNLVRRPAAEPAASTDSAEELNFMSAFKKLLKKHEKTPDDAQEHAAGGKAREKTIMDAVDEAVAGADGAHPDY